MNIYAETLKLLIGKKKIEKYSGHFITGHLKKVVLTFSDKNLGHIRPKNSFKPFFCV